MIVKCFGSASATQKEITGKWLSLATACAGSRIKHETNMDEKIRRSIIIIMRRTPIIATITWPKLSYLSLTLYAAIL